MATSASDSPASLQPFPPKVFKLSPPSREVLPRKLARNLLKPLSAEPYTTIELSGCAIGDAAAGLAGPQLVILAGKKSLRTVILADIIASLPTVEALRSLSALSASIGMWKGLHTVDLSHNALGSRGLAACMPILSGQPLRQLFLSGTGLAAESARLLCDYVAPSPTTDLRILDVHANRLESTGLNHLSTIIAKSPSLTHLRVSSNGASENSIETLATALSVTSTLEELDISDNAIHIPSATRLAKTLSSQSNLVRLCLSDLDMKDETLSALLTPLSPPPPLAALLLNGNSLSSVALLHLDAFILSCPSLRILSLSSNELGDDGIEHLAGVIQQLGAKCQLEKLFLADVSASPLAFVKIALQLAKLPTFRRLDIRGNPLPHRVATALSAALTPLVVLYDEREEAGEALEEGEVSEEKLDKELETALQDLEEIGNDFKPPVLSPASEAVSATILSEMSVFSRGVKQMTDSFTNLDEGLPKSSGGHFMEQDSGIVKEVDSESGEDVEVAAVADMNTPSPKKKCFTTSTKKVVAQKAATPQTLSKVLNQSRGIVETMNKSMASLCGDLKNTTDELEMPNMPTLDGVYSGDKQERDNYLLIGEESNQSCMVGCIGGLLVAAFVIVLVLALAQSLEDIPVAYQIV